jgi:hypothetical protein
VWAALRLPDAYAHNLRHGCAEQIEQKRVLPYKAERLKRRNILADAYEGYCRSQGDNHSEESKIHCAYVYRHLPAEDDYQHRRNNHR